ncbi:MAG: MMPL family transporter [Firmicutes bacterium]|nr:MMPL family transporter [Bacillota bacterium]
MLAKFSVKKPMTIVVAVILIIILGVMSFLNTGVDLLPEIELPYVIVMTTYPGAAPESVETDITKPLELSLGLVSGLKNISSVSSENVSMVFLEFDQEINIDSVMVELSSLVDAAAASFPDSAAAPTMLRLNPSMLPVMMMTADMDGMTDIEFSEYVGNQIIPAFERLEGVASVEAMGLVTQQVELQWKEDAIEHYNNLILNEIDSTLAEGKRELDKARAELEQAKTELADKQEELYHELGEASSQLEDGRLQLQLGLNQLAAAPEELQAQREELVQSRASLVAMLDMFDAATQIEDGLTQLEEAIDQMNAVSDELSAQFGSPEAAVRALENQQAALDSAYQSYQSALATGVEGQIATAYAALVTQLQASATLLGQLATVLPGDGSNSGSFAPSLLQDVELAYSLVSSLSSQTIAGLNEFIAGQREAEAAYSDLKIQQSKLEMAMSMAGGMNKSEVEDAIDQIDEGIIAIDKALLVDLPEQQQRLEEQKAQLDDSATELEIGKMWLSTELSSASVQLAIGESQLDAAYEEFAKQQDEAFKNAGLHGALTPELLATILGAEHFSMPAGYIQDGEEQILLKVGDKFLTLDELADFTIMNVDIEGVGEIKVNDVTEVTLNDTSGEYYSLVNGNPWLIISIQKQSIYSTVEVADSINTTMERLMEENEGLHLNAISDQGYYIHVAINSVLNNLLLGAILAIIILAIFLRSIRPTLIIAFSIPISLLFALTLMYFSGVTINMISLAGLALGVGMLVDNSIVVIENIFRLRAEGKSAATAAVMGAKQVTGAIAASTLTTVCVFLPVLFTHGITRQIFADMGLTVGYSLFTSLLVALTMIPAASSNILRKEPPSSKLQQKMVDKYLQLLKRNLQHKWVVFAIAVAVVVIAGVSIASMGTSLMPSVDYGQLAITLTAEDEEASESEVQALATETMQRIMDNVEGLDIVAALENGGGTMGMLNTSSDSKAISMYGLMDPDSGISGAEAQKKIEQLTVDLPVVLEISGAGADMSMIGSSGIEIQIKGEETDAMRTAAEEVAQLMAGIEGLTNIESGLDDSSPELRVTVDKNKAMEYNLTVAQVYQALAADINSEQEVMQIMLEDKQYPVIIASDPEHQLSRESLADFSFEVETTDISNGQTESHTVYLSQIATIQEVDSPTAINRLNQSRVHSVTAAVDDEHNIGLVSPDLEAALASYQPPAGCSIEIEGENVQIQDAMKDLITMLLLAAALIYLIMVAQFQSLLLPFIIIFTIPLAFSGGLLTLVLCGMEVSIIAMIGMLVLSGIIVNNGIVYVDCVNQLRLSGMEKHEAMIEAGRRRLRPILMTALTTICSMFAMVFSQEMGSEMIRPMAIVATGGLIYATILTLFLVPALYDLFQRRAVKTVVVEDGEIEEYE